MNEEGEGLDDQFIQNDNIPILWRGRISLDDKELSQKAQSYDSGPLKLSESAVSPNITSSYLKNNENSRNNITTENNRTIENISYTIEDLRQQLELSHEVKEILGPDILSRIANSEDDISVDDRKVDPPLASSLETSPSLSSNRNINSSDGNKNAVSSSKPTDKSSSSNPVSYSNQSYNGATFGLGSSTSKHQTDSVRRDFNIKSAFSPWTLSGGAPNFSKAVKLSSNQSISYHMDMGKLPDIHQSSSSMQGNVHSVEVQPSRPQKRSRDEMTDLSHMEEEKMIDHINPEGKAEKTFDDEQTLKRSKVISIDDIKAFIDEEKSNYKSLQQKILQAVIKGPNEEVGKDMNYM